jgi:hypothetical protein
MTKFTEKSFSVSCNSGGVTDDELAKRWEMTFGKKKAKGAPAEEAAEAKDDEQAPEKKKKAKKA